MIWRDAPEGCTCQDCTLTHTHYGRVKPYRCPSCTPCRELTT